MKKEEERIVTIFVDCSFFVYIDFVSVSKGRYVS